MTTKISPAMADVLRQIDAGKSPMNLTAYSGEKVDRAVTQCRVACLFVQPAGKRQLTDAGRVALQQWEKEQ